MHGHPTPSPWPHLGPSFLRPAFAATRARFDMPKHCSDAAFHTIVASATVRRSPLKRTKEFVRLSWQPPIWVWGGGISPRAFGQRMQPRTSCASIRASGRQLTTYTNKCLPSVRASRRDWMRVALEPRKIKCLAEDERRCTICAVPLRGKRADARFCSVVCRAKNALRSTARSHRPS